MHNIKVLSLRHKWNVVVIKVITPEFKKYKCKSCNVVTGPEGATSNSLFNSYNTSCSEFVLCFPAVFHTIIHKNPVGTQ